MARMIGSPLGPLGDKKKEAEEEEEKKGGI